MNTADSQITVAPSGQLTLATDPVASMLQKMVDGGITKDNVEALTKLADLYERMQQKDAEKQFAAAFVALQSDLPVIEAQTVIPNRGKYEKFEDVMHVVGPLLTKHGFSVSFSMDFKENRILETCHLQHVAGVVKSNSFAVRSGKADSDTQADCKAATTAKRNALLNCLNIVIRQDALQNEEGDATLDGAPVTFEQAETLRELVKETKSDEPAFLKWAGASKFEEIAASKYDRVFSALQKKLRP